MAAQALLAPLTVAASAILRRTTLLPAGPISRTTPAMELLANAVMGARLSPRAKTNFSWQPAEITAAR
jgi:hypothetical protein